MDIIKIAKLLERVKVKLQTSENDAWSGASRNELIEIIEQQLELIKESKSVDEDELRLLFMPTSDLQDTSIDNGWGNDYLKISSEMDKLLA